MAARQVLLMNIPAPIRKPRQFRATNLEELTERELRERYRFGRNSLNYLVNLLEPELKRGTSKTTALSVEQQVCIALRYYASGSFLQVVGDTLGFDKSTVSRTIDAVTNALLARKNDFIKWPLQQDICDQIKLGFYGMANFPNVIGCIDCTHVRIQAPTEDEPSFVNRKCYHSINTQAVCDHEGLFSNFAMLYFLLSCFIYIVIRNFVQLSPFKNVLTNETSPVTDRE